MSWEVRGIWAGCETTHSYLFTLVSDLRVEEIVRECARRDGDSNRSQAPGVAVTGK